LFKSFIKKIILALIRFYQASYVIRQPKCRFDPSCSEYAKQAFSKYGLFRASFKTIKRLLKCHPFGSYGYDPVE